MIQPPEEPTSADLAAAASAEAYERVAIGIAYLEYLEAKRNERRTRQNVMLTSPYRLGFTDTARLRDEWKAAEAAMWQTLERYTKRLQDLGQSSSRIDQALYQRYINKII